MAATSLTGIGLKKFRLDPGVRSDPARRSTWTPAADRPRAGTRGAPGSWVSVHLDPRAPSNRTPGDTEAFSRRRDRSAPRRSPGGTIHAWPGVSTRRRVSGAVRRVRSASGPGRGRGLRSTFRAGSASGCAPRTGRPPSRLAARGGIWRRVCSTSGVPRGV